MKIIVDEDGKKAVQALVDIALKTGGISNLNGSIDILKSLEEYKEPVEDKKE
jgi:hypothetical protein